MLSDERADKPSVAFYLGKVLNSDQSWLHL